MASLLHQVAWVLSSIAALNWGLVELLDTNLVTDTLGLGAETAGLVYIVLAVAGLVSLYHFYEGEIEG